METRNIRLIISGDFVPVRPLKKDSDNYFSGLSEFFSECDLHITNLEAPLTNSQKGIKKIGPLIKADPSSVLLLKDANVNIACLANNHIYDYSEQGIEDTIRACESANIETVGIVSRKGRESHWLIKSVKDKKIGFLNYCEHEFSVREEGLIGASGYDPVKAYYDINHLKDFADCIIVIYHGGNEYYPLPRPGLKNTFHYLADLGADAVIGHHTHVFSGYELYKSKPLIYSLGNFWFPCEDEPEESNYGILCRLTIREKIEMELIPFLQDISNGSIVVLSGNSAQNIMKKIDSFSGIIRDDSFLNKKWQEFVGQRAVEYLKQIPGTGFIGRVLLKAGIPVSRILPFTKSVNVFNNLRCESHLDITRESLKRLINNG
jgi:poly-gamma-glutamate capsule biosynthesis protein CapA/YwtB (metallophosphatase superfamily)